MKKHKKSICIVTLFLSSCGGGEWDTYLHVQRIPNSNKVIYEYDAWGGRDSHQFGIVIMDSTENFEVNKVRNLPISYFTEVPNSSRIHAISLRKAKTESISLKPIERQTPRIADLDLVIDYYEQYNGNSDAGCGLNKYEFLSFRETKDSLYLKGVKEVFGVSLEGKDVVGFQKGNIKLITDSNGKLMRLEIEELFKGKANKRKYKKGTAEDIKRIENSPVVCLRTYYFKPLKTIYSSDFTDYGIFKPIIKNTLPNPAQKPSFGSLTLCFERWCKRLSCNGKARLHINHTWLLNLIHMKTLHMLLAAILLLVNTAFCAPVAFDEEKSEGQPQNILLSRYGALIEGSELLATGGLISVTDTKLVFTPVRTFLSKDVSISEIPLSEIAEVMRVNTLGIMPNGILLRLQDGTTHKLKTVVFRRKKLYRLLLSQAKQ